MWHGEIQVRECGVRAADLEAQRAALIEFAAEMYRPLVRCDQRAKGEQYVRGPLLEGRRKSIQPMAARLPDRDEHGLQQFITDSPWEDEPVRRRLARRMTPEIEPEGWIVDDTGLPKHGRFSPEVAHQYCGALGKTANCQVLVSVNAASDRASCPLPQGPRAGRRPPAHRAVSIDLICVSIPVPSVGDPYHLGSAPDVCSPGRCDSGRGVVGCRHRCRFDREPAVSRLIGRASTMRCCF